MLLQWMWFSMMAFSLIYAAITGNGETLMNAALNGTSLALEVTMRLGAGYLFFCGVLEIAREAGIARLIEKLMHPVLKRLMPHMGKASETISVNLSMNVLGLGNAATPMGLEAMRLLDQEQKENPVVRHDIYMLLVLNATSLQLLPTTVLTLRMTAGSLNPNAVVMPTMICTAVSTIVGAFLARLMHTAEEKRIG